MVKNISNATASNMTDNVTAYSVDSMTTNGATGNGETTYQNTRWAQQWGYFNQIPDLKAALTSKCQWICGKGYNCDAETKVRLEFITGWGKDTFQSILYNLLLTAKISGDSFAEVIRDDKKHIVNLKVLDPSSIRIVCDNKGILTRYEQTSKVSKDLIKFKPNEILHFSNNRLADQIHGISDIDAIEKTLLANGESFTDVQKIMHRSARPMIMFHVPTDDQTKINAFIAKMDAATKLGENIYIPGEANSGVTWEVVKIDVSPFILAWRDDLRKGFYRTIGLPELLPSGGGDATESGGKIGYLAFEQVWSKEQLDVENDLWSQLQIKIKLNPPTSLAENLAADSSKDGSANRLNMQPNDVQAGVGQ